MNNEDIPQNQTMNSTDVRANWSQLLLDVYNHKSRVLVQKSGIPVAAIISMNELKRFQRLEQERAERFKALDASWSAFMDADLGDVEAEVTKAVAEARADIRTEREAAARRA